MKKIIIVTACLLTLNLGITAQSIQRSVIASAGTVFSNGSAKISFTVGETAVQQFTNVGTKLNQGFQQSHTASTPLPIVGLEFTAIRLNENNVEVTWKTQQEINNKGFYIQRQLDNENDFTTQDFVDSKAEGGNTTTELNYHYMDKNSYTGYSYYRLKQEDLDGKYIYSVTRSVVGANANWATLKVWPIPANEVVNVQVQGLTKADQITVYDINGKIVQQIPITNYSTVQVRNLIPGNYFIHLDSDKAMYQKIIVQ